MTLERTHDNNVGAAYSFSVLKYITDGRYFQQFLPWSYPPPPPTSSRRHVQGGSNMTGTNCDLFTHKSSRSYLNHLVFSDTCEVAEDTDRRGRSEFLEIYSRGKRLPGVNSIQQGLEVKI
jgi:hypothetical protein